MRHSIAEAASRVVQVVDTAAVGVAAGRAIASEVAVQALSMVIAIKIWRNLTLVRRRRRQSVTATSTYN
jgi:hypothetical protein